MAVLLTGGGVDRGGAVSGGEVTAGRETGYVTNIAEEPGGTRRPDPVEGEQAAAGGLDQLEQLLVRRLDLLVNPVEVDLRDVQIAARHADPRTTMSYDRARKNLDRHPNYILAAYMASGT